MEKLFSTLNLSKEVLRAVETLGYTEMTDIQAGAIPLVLEGRDIIGRSSTGTGKTAAFGIPAIERVTGGSQRKVQVLVLSPTRELAMQIGEEMYKYAKYKESVKLATVYGGQSMLIQIRQLKTANVVIGTPGRLMDHMRRRTIDLSELSMVILDEADEMLNMGFLEDIQTILKEVPEDRQTLLFSATMPPAIMKITKEFQKNPEIVAVDNNKRTLDTTKQYFYLVPPNQKKDAINLLMQAQRPKRSVVFCNTKKMVDELTEYLNENKFKALGIHGDMRQTQRTQVMGDFKSGRIAVLVATDVAARGIDVDDIEVIYNFDIPMETEYYIHRIGRTGRAGKEGISCTLAGTQGQVRQIMGIEREIGAPILRSTLPKSEDIMLRRQEKFLSKIEDALSTMDAEKWMLSVDTLVGKGHSERDIACALMSMMVSKDHRSVPVIREPAPLRPAPQRGGAVGQYNGRPEFSNRTKISLNVGWAHKIATNFIVGAIVEATGMPAKNIGKIEIFDAYTTVELSAEDAKLVMKDLHGGRIKGNQVEVSLAKSAPSYIPRSDFPGRKKPSYNAHMYQKRKGTN